MLPTTVDRRGQFYSLLGDLTKQIAMCGSPELVEVLIEEDSKEISIGTKRQKLLDRAKGEFCIGIDSDDSISNLYVSSLLDAIKNNPGIDHVGFIESVSFNGIGGKQSFFSIKYHHWAENIDGWDYIRCANPKSCIRTEIAKQVGFEDARFGEDIKFSEAVTPLLKSEFFLDKILYYYNYIETPFDVRYGINTLSLPNETSKEMG